jgi:hypothetical protein
MNKFKIAIVAIIVAASAAVSITIQHRAQIKLREQSESLRQQADEVAQVSAENERLSNLIGSVKSPRPLSREQLTELLRLRSEVGQLRNLATIRPKLQETNAQLRATEANIEKQLAEAQAAPNYWPKDQLTFAGYSNPESALKSMLAAMVSGDVSSWRQSCTPEALGELNKEWEAHGLSETQQEAEVERMAAMLVSSSAGFHILDEQMPSPDEAIVNLSFDGEGTARKFVLKQVGSEWKFRKLIFAGEPEQ